MKKLFYSNLISLMLLLGWTSSGMAQDFVVLEDSVYTEGTTSQFEFVAYNYLVNVSDEPLDITWVRESNEIPGDWETAVCDIILCHDTHISQAEFTLQPGDTGNIDVHYRPFEEAGLGKVDVLLYVTDEGPENGQSMEFYGEAKEPTLINEEATQPELSFYPNPVSEHLNIRMGTAGDYEVKVYNVLGKQVERTIIKNSNYTRLQFNDYPSGVYMVTVKDKQNGQRVTQRFTKE